ncbi:MAG: sigma-70 family RNA polymerase sigma factor [Aquamicrobium sp.]|nr:sigma-70 family RNA polymerase sigma factor [Aquamicrobium sp.]
MPHVDATRTQETVEPTEVAALIPALRAFARTFCREPSDADDLVQETLTKAIAKIHQFEKGTRLKSWLFTIMRNSFYNRMVITNREAPSAADCASTLPSTKPSQEWSLKAAETRRAMLRLPRRQREIIVMIAIQGTSYKEAARKCGCDVGTIKSRLSRSRANLVSELGETSASALFNRA